jgi:putative ABC transport system permease protein
MIEDYFKLAINSLTKRRLRSWLTMLGIFIGIAAVVSLISLSQGMQNAINDQFKKLGADKVSIQLAGGGEGTGAPSTGAALTDSDADSIRKVLGVEAVSGRLLEMGKISYNRITRYTYLGGLDLGQEDLKILDGTGFTDLQEGRFLRTSDNFKIVVGNNYITEDNPFKKAIRLGSVITINNVPFEVVGILKKSGTFFIDSTIVMKKGTLRDMYNLKNKEETVIAARIQQGADINQVAADIEKKLRRTRNVEEGKEDFSVSTPQQILNSFLTIFNIVTGVVIGIAAISLLVGGVGIMNTMYTAVLERTREIGILKAIGARNSDVLILFLIESGLLGMAGGIIGVLLGLALSKTVEIVAAGYLGSTIIKASMDLWLIFGALSFSFIVGSLSGILPAIQAATMHPVDALKRR